MAWPLPALKWYRLWGTNGGTNAAGNLFALLVLFSIYFNSKIKKTSISALKTVLFIICLLLSGSFSSIGGIMIVSFITIVLIKELRVFNFKQLIISLFIFIGVVSFSGTIKDNLLLRVQKQFRVYGEFRLMPYSLEDRLHWWYKQIEKTQSDNKLMFGYGPGGLAKYIGTNSNIDTGAESYYLTLLQLYGLPSILYFIVLIVFLLYLIKITYPFYKHMEILFPVILFYPIAGIANETLHYGAMTEIFGFTISLLAVLNYNTKLLRT